LFLTAKKHLCIATRKSPLAYWQANTIKKQLEKHYPFLCIKLLPLLTQGDKQLEKPLNSLGGKGLFVSELEKALLNGQADIAVHSMKDVPMDLEKGLMLGAICQREDPRDVLISQSGATLQQLSSGSSIGSSSLRRQAQLLALRPDIKVQPLRGNVGSRLEKLMAGKYDAIILAAAGLIRLEKTTCISEYLPLKHFLPAPGQGALGIECRTEDKEVVGLITVLNHVPSYQCILAERALGRQLGGGCQVPLAAYAVDLANNQLYLQGLVAKPDGSVLIKAEKYGSLATAEELGMSLAKELIAKGAPTLLQNLY
jgi:hydroxymethylbilane synthase